MIVLKFKQNIEKILCIKALKEINTVVDNDRVNEKHEKIGAKIVRVLIFVFLLAAIYVFTL